MSREELFAQRIARVRALMEEHGVDLYAVYHDEDVSNRIGVEHLCGFTGSRCFIFISQGDATILVDPRYTTQAREEVVGMDVVEVKGAGRLYEHEVPAVLAGSKNIGLSEWNVPWGFVRKIQTNSDCPPVPLPEILQKVRAVKGDDEVAKIQSAIRATERALRQTLDFVRPGVSEKDVAKVFEEALPEGAILAFESIVASGSKSLQLHHRASDKIIEEGDVIQFDVGCMLDGYVSDISRMAVCGEATDEQKHMHAAILRAIDEALRLYRPGRRAAEAYPKADAVLLSAGYEKLSRHHSLGHGIGLEVHELPVSGPDPIWKEYVFEVGNVLSIEPGVYMRKFGYGMRVERDVVITEDGHEVLDDQLPVELFELG